LSEFEKRAGPRKNNIIIDWPTKIQLIKTTICLIGDDDDGILYLFYFFAIFFYLIIFHVFISYIIRSGEREEVGVNAWLRKRSIYF
jgi:hypothetical protein